MLLASIPANAIGIGSNSNTTIQLSSGKSVTLTKEQLDNIISITQQEAEYIATLFVADMIKADTVVWNENTKIVSVVPMYDNTNTNTVTAYTINLTEGYVVISAFLDTEMQILEWSDKATPIYQELDTQENEKIIYLGKYEYYVDKGNGQFLDLNNEHVELSDMHDNITEIRDVKNIPENAILSIQDNINSSSRSSITDMLTHANANYPGPFVYNNHVDMWYKNGADVFDYYTDSYPSQGNYNGPCGPIAITNTIIAYRNRYRASAPDVPVDNNSVFANIAGYGITNNYYKKWPSYNESTGAITAPAGTLVSNMNAFTLGSYHYYNLLPTVTTDSDGLGSYNSFNQELSANHLLIISTPGTSNSVGHAIVCRGFTRYISEDGQWYLSYIHIADGLNSSIRYAPMGWYTGSHTIVINYH